MTYMLLHQEEQYTKTRNRKCIPKWKSSPLPTNMMIEGFNYFSNYTNDIFNIIDVIR